MFFFKRRRATSFPPATGKVEVFIRHCLSSSASKHKKRPPGFSHRNCYENFLQTTDLGKVNVTCWLDLGPEGKREDHFLDDRFSVVTVREGTEAGSFLKLLDYVEKKKFPPETILYFLEDDYLHKPGWVDVLLEGMALPGVDYVTLYDHRDKYFFPMYASLTSRLFLTASTHWRTVPSTTQTFAVHYGTLMKDLSIHRRFSQKRKISADHDKFCKLGKKGAVLISPIPGFSTHAEPEYASPFFDIVI